ncbi:hypothetical protein Q8F55_003740 [Vanrija albida]|uniref:RING-type domain-containing protein n=1 Tax=Vanrija albida TaxID=181172 RepID=A0ABR3Q5U6_9TREE
MSPPTVAALPTLSECQGTLPTSEYDLLQLKKAFAARDKVTAGEPVNLSLLHLHSLTLQETLEPEPEYHEYSVGGGVTELRPNEGYAVWETLRDSVHKATDACVPIALAPPSPTALRTPVGNSKAMAGRTGNIFLPVPTKSKTATRAVEKPLAKLPQQLPASGRQFLHSTTAWDTQNWLHAVLGLSHDQALTRRTKYRPEKQVLYLCTGVGVTWVPSDDALEEGVEIRLHITIDVYLDLEALNQPLPDIGAEMIGLVISALMPTDEDIPDERDAASFQKAHATALTTFYNSLHSAPTLPDDFDMRRLQPREMTSRLLPFQRRTLARLLEREDAPVTGVSKPSSPAGQWIKVDLERFGTYAFRRLTGELKPLSDRKGKGRAGSTDGDEELDALPKLFDLSRVRGTMLCEEMGLGKTVEAIALVLLHRHPLSIPRPHTEPQYNEYAVRLSPQINLLAGAPDHDKPEFRAWLDKEHDAFADAVSWSDESQLSVSEIGATLIVTPLPLMKQWIAEMNAHAPSLRICEYPGWKALIAQVEKKRNAHVKQRVKQAADKQKRKMKQFRNETRRKYAKGKDGKKVPLEMEDEGHSDDEDVAESTFDEETLLEHTQRAFLDYVRGHDVVITTYQTLGDDLTVAAPVPPRSRRANVAYKIGERPRSPLVMVEWWRVVMDEVQLQGNQSQAAEMVSLIPRKFSLAMSGTPARTNVLDLAGSLNFLRVPGVNRVLWHRLTQLANRSAFHGLFQPLAVRTTKAQVVDEFNIPHQTRFVVPIDLSDIESHYYFDTLERQRERLRRDEVSLSTSLRHLRQICTHIQVGALNATAANRPIDRADRLHLGRQLMTMDEALSKMRLDHENEYLLQTRHHMRALVRKAQLLILDERDPDDIERHQLMALALYERAREEGSKILEPAQARLAAIVGDREDSIDDTELDKAASQQEKDHAKSIMAARGVIRETLIIIHQTWFLEGDIHHVQKDEEKEVVAYKAAEVLRKDILARPLKIAGRQVEAMITSIQRAPAISTITELQTTDTRRVGGLASVSTIGEVNGLLKILNDNAVLVFNWRSKVIDLLNLPLEAEEDKVPAVGQGQDVENPDQEYYAEALKAQGDVEAYLTAYAAAIADRKEMLVEERSVLATHDARMVKKRTTRAAKEAQDGVEEIPLNDVEDLTLKLMTERQAFRDRRREEDCERPLKALLITLTSIVHGQFRAEEIMIAKAASEGIRTYINKQSELVEKLNKELDLFRVAFNKRVVYFAALQEISDSVATPMFKDVGRDIAIVDKDVIDGDVLLARMAVRGRYLNFLGSKDNANQDVHSECSICFGTSDDTHAILLNCGHAFCVSCFREYRKAAHVGKKCATCQTPIKDREFTKIRLNRSIEGESGEGEGSGPREEEMPESQQEEEPEDDDEAAEREAQKEREARAADLEKLNMLPFDKQRAILAMDMMGEFGSKINFLIKHLHYYRSTRPGSRHVVFSNWADSLSIVERALSVNRIKYVSFESNSKSNNVVEEFHRDRSISVFLLHAERESAGLTLTSCEVVHLLEPVLQHSFELQAIGRVDRLGQNKETTVFCYATMETVEARILSEGVRNGTSIYLADAQEDEKAVAAMPNVAHAAHRGGDVTVNAFNTEKMMKLIM